jgi:hypothetical protein
VRFDGRAHSTRASLYLFLRRLSLLLAKNTKPQILSGASCGRGSGMGGYPGAKVPAQNTQILV